METTEKVSRRIKRMYGSAALYYVRMYYAEREIDILKCDKGSDELAAIRIAVKTANKMTYKKIPTDQASLRDFFADRYKDEMRRKSIEDKERRESEEILNSIEGFLSIEDGANSYVPKGRYGKENRIEVSEEKDYNGYSRSCKFTMIRRRVIITIKRGYTLHNVGGLMTFVKGEKIDRSGMGCEWAVQGRSYSDVVMHKGYLVKGEHIEAKSLAEARRINSEHRGKILAKLLEDKSKREKLESSAKKVAVTVNDSLDSGNCMFGTMDFKGKVERVLGHTIDHLSGDLVLKYGKVFHVESYAEKAVREAIRKSGKNK